MKYERLLVGIGQVSSVGQAAAARAINQILTVRNWLIGAYLVEYEQNGQDRADYGAQLFKKLSKDLKQRGFRGFSPTNLKNFRQFALTYPGLARAEILNTFLPLLGSSRQPAEIRQTLSGEFGTDPLQQLEEQQTADLFSNSLDTLFPTLLERNANNPSMPWQDCHYYQRLFTRLSWSNLIELTRLDDPLKRAFYELEAVKSNWSIRELRRQINSMLYERIGLSKDKDALLSLAQQGQLIRTPATIMRDPYILEFLGLEERSTYSESDLEQALIDHLQQFMHELGHDFCFINRQFRITTKGQHYFLDLLFYHRTLRCLVAIDLKLGAFRPEYAGQMNFYLNYLKEEVSHKDENPPVGILLCAEKDVEEVYYATAGIDSQLFVSRYVVELPSKEKLKQWLKQEKERIESSPD